MLAINSFVDAGRFQVLDVLGKGGSGIAYLAIDTHSSPKHPKYYAIKCVPRPANDADTSSLLREIRLHKLVSQHPAIVTLKRCIQEGPYQLFIMDFMPGGDLFKQITQQHRYFHNDALITDVFLQILGAVEYCHEQGVYHRDLKPENILCNEDGTRVVLADFGLATRQLVSDDLGVGSGYYMSPECNSGPAYSTIANDMWSLGVILCNLAFGRNPWAQAVSTDATFAAYASNPSYLSAILPASPAVARILTGPRGLFSIDPRRRMNLKELREEMMGVERWTMSEDQIKYASPEARSVAGVLRNAVKGRDARLAPTQTAQSQSQSEVQRRRATTMQTREVFIPPASLRQQEAVAPQQIIVPPAPPPAPARPASVVPHHQQQQQNHGRNSSLRLVLQKVAAPFTSSPHSHTHARKTSTATGGTAFSSSSSSSSSSLNSPMPMTPPASSYHSAVDVTSLGYHHHYHHHHQQSNYGQVWHGSSLTPPPPPGLTMGIGKTDWAYQQHQQQVIVPQVQPVGGVRR